jgi:hypothetical protein
MAIWRKVALKPVRFEPLIIMTHIEQKYDVELGCYTKEGFRNRSGQPVSNVYAWANVREVVPRDKYAYFT